MATNNVIWDPSSGRFRNRTNGQFATQQQMQQAGVTPRAQPTQRHVWAASSASAAPPDSGSAQRDAQGRFISQGNRSSSQAQSQNWLTRPRNMSWLTNSRPVTNFMNSRVGSSLSAGASWLSNAASQGGSFLQSTTSGVSSVLSGITRPISAVFGIIGAFGRALGAITQVITSVVGVLMRALAMLGKMIGGVLVTVISLLVAKFVSLIGAVVMVTKSAMSLARDLALIHANTGLSFTQGKGITDRLGAFGVKSSEVAGFMKDGPLMMRLKAGMYGMPALTDKNYPTAMAARYQQMATSGPFGRMMANNALDSQFGGSAPDNIRLMANMPIKTIQSQMDYNDKVQGQLGVNPEVLRKFSEEVPLVINRIGMLWEAVKVKFAVEMLPLIENSLGFVADFLGKNIGNIAKWIGQAAEWMVKVFPFMIIDGLKAVNDGALWFVNALTTGAHYIADGMRGLAAMFEAFANGDESFLDSIGSVLKGFDNLSLGLNGVAALWNTFINTLADAIIMLVPGLNVAMAAKGWRPDNPIDTWNKNMGKGTDFYGAFENFRNSKTPGNFAASLRSGADTVDASANAASQWAQGKHDAGDSVLNSAEKWMKGQQQIVSATQRTATATETTAKATLDTAQNTFALMNNLMSRLMSNLVEDESFNLTRTSG